MEQGKDSNQIPQSRENSTHWEKFLGIFPLVSLWDSEENLGIPQRIPAHPNDPKSPGGFFVDRDLPAGNIFLKTEENLPCLGICIKFRISCA